MRRSSIEHVESKHLRKDVADFRTGDTVRVHWKVREGEKERVQSFEGIVIRKTKGSNRATFTVRKISYGVGVERIFPLHSPRYEKIEVISHGSVHRNRLFFLRNLKGKASRVEVEEQQGGAGSSGARAPASTGGADQKAAGPEGEQDEGKPEKGGAAAEKRRSKSLSAPPPATTE
jgi:large subunit ribosomal protein L19